MYIVAFDNNVYQAEYKRQNYDIVRALVPRGRGKDIKAFAKSQGKSVSQIIVDALESTYGLDLSKLDGE